MSFSYLKAIINTLSFGDYLSKTYLKTSHCHQDVFFFATNLDTQPLKQMVIYLSLLVAVPLSC